MQALNIAATGMLAQQTNVEVISNNISNMGTTGFKRHRAEFQDLLYQDLRRVGSNSSDAGTIVPSGLQLGVGTRVASTYRIGEQGALSLTDNPFDLAINGEGFSLTDLILIVRNLITSSSNLIKRSYSWIASGGPSIFKSV